MAKKKKLTKAERKEARLRKGKQWLLTYTGSPKKMNKHYRERFHVDVVTAAKDLQELGVNYTQEQLDQIKRAEEQRLQQRRMEREAKERERLTTKKINHCTIAQKYRYDARFADRKYREKLSGSRAGINMTKHELRKKDGIVSPLIEQGQSPYQIITNHPELDMSVRSLYTYLDQGLFTARNIDLKRKPGFKPRKCHKTQITNRTVFEKRLFSDFSELQLSSFVEMDTVHSSRESNKTLLTFFFTKEKLFLAFLLNRCTKGAVRLIFDRLEKRMGTYEFLSVFEYILTDRGSEFGDPVALETGLDEIQRTSIYYCDPMRSGQKGGLEQAHTMLRMVLPKGTSFEFLTQWDVNLIVNHINSTPRESLNGSTPYDAALETLGKETLNAFQLKRIDPDLVNLTPKLIRFNH